MDIKLIDQIQNMPNKPGVYLMLDCEGCIIYVGKAKSLKARIKNYFNKEIKAPKIQMMLNKIDSIKFITTNNETEALILEDSLIKKHKPKYNTLLKDDKKFPWIKITNERYPRIIITRTPERNQNSTKACYYGPFVSINALHNTLEYIKKVFPLKQCNKPVYRDKPCTNYHIKRCLGPCQELVSQENYKELIFQIEMFLSGRQSKLIELLNSQMIKASSNLEYEKAAQYRDTIRSMELVIQSQKVIFDDKNIEKDLFSYANDENNIAIVLLKIREGKLISLDSYDFEMNNISPEDMFSNFITEYYSAISFEDIPNEVILPLLNEEIYILKKMLMSIRTTGIEFLVPENDDITDLYAIALSNANESLKKVQLKNLKNIHYQWDDIALEIKEKLYLDKAPVIVECFDISHLGGKDTVASVVVFEKGKPLKSEYRKYKINLSSNKIDDYKSIYEAVKRRHGRKLLNNKMFSDLIIIDGGKGQLNSAIKALKELNITSQKVVSLAKRLEEVFIQSNSIPIVFERNSLILHFFQQIRDEAHRFALSYQKDLRSRRMTQSKLENIKFIGEKRKKSLLNKFKTVSNIYNANIEDFIGVPGIDKTIATHLYNELHKQ